MCRFCGVCNRPLVWPRLLHHIGRPIVTLLVILTPEYHGFSQGIADISIWHGLYVVCLWRPEARCTNVSVRGLDDVCISAIVSANATSGHWRRGQLWSEMPRHEAIDRPSMSRIMCGIREREGGASVRRIVGVGGDLRIHTLRSDVEPDDFATRQRSLADSGLWMLVETGEPFASIASEPHIRHRCWIWRVLQTT